MARGTEAVGRCVKVIHTPVNKMNPAGESGHDLQKNMTRTEKEVYQLLVQEFLAPVEISRRRGCSKSAISNIISKLRKKGYINKVNYSPVNHTCSPSGVVHYDLPEHPIRLHAEQYRIRILESSEKYRKTLARCNSTFLDGNRVVLYRDVVMTFSYQYFLGKDDEECDAVAAQYWIRFFSRIEGEFGIIILKERAQNIKRVRAEYAELHNELAQETRRRRKRIRVFSSTDGKTWLLVDDSLKGDEMEAVHAASQTDPRDAKEDMGSTVQPFFNDLRDNKPPLPSEQYRMHQMLFAAVSKLTDERYIEKVTQRAIEQALRQCAAEDKDRLNKRPSYFG